MYTVVGALSLPYPRLHVTVAAQTTCGRAHLPATTTIREKSASATITAVEIGKMPLQLEKVKDLSLSLKNARVEFCFISSELRTRGLPPESKKRRVPSSTHRDKRVLFRVVNGQG